MTEFLNRMNELMFLQRPLGLWIMGGVAFVIVLTLLPIIKRIAHGRVSRSKPAEHTALALIAGLIKRWGFLTTIAVAVAAGSMAIEPAGSAARILRFVVVAVAAIQLIRWVRFVIFWGTVRNVANQTEPGTEPDRAVIGAMATFRWLAQLVAYTAVLLLALQNLGVDITALIAGLGVAGIAVALAVQNILGDLFASLSITLDKPFVPGDFIVLGTEMGTVEKIGLKTTRVRSLSGEQLVFSNNDLLSSRVRNFKRMFERRVVFGFGVLYSTPPDMLEKIPGIVREAIEAEELARFDRCHFYRFGDSSLDFETVYHVKSPEYNKYMDTQQRVCMHLVRQFKEMGIGFAFPTRTLHLESVPSEVHAARSMAGDPSAS